MKIVLKSYPGHAGRPGQVGGSAPRSGSAASPTTAKPKKLDMETKKNWLI